MVLYCRGYEWGTSKYKPILKSLKGSAIHTCVPLSKGKVSRSGDSKRFGITVLRVVGGMVLLTSISQITL